MFLTDFIANSHIDGMEQGRYSGMKDRYGGMRNMVSIVERKLLVERGYPYSWNDRYPYLSSTQVVQTGV